MKGNLSNKTKLKQKQRKEALQEELKQIIEQIKETYFEFLSSLKFQNINDKRSYKQTAKTHRTHEKGHGEYNEGSSHTYHNVGSHENGYQDNNHYLIEQEDQYAEQHINELQMKTFSFQQELSVQNKGYLAFIRLINNIKQLQDYNHYLRSIVMGSDTEDHLGKFQQDLIDDLKKLELDIPNTYFSKKL